jgi:hypothetical protein
MEDRCHAFLLLLVNSWAQGVSAFSKSSLSTSYKIIKLNCIFFPFIVLLFVLISANECHYFFKNYYSNQITGPIFCCCYIWVLSLFFFSQYRGLNAGTTPWATPLIRHFQDRVSGTICLVWFQTMVLLISAAWIARMTGMSHWCLAWVLLSIFFF